MNFRTRLIVVISVMTLGTLAFSLAAVYVGVNRVQERVLDRELLSAARQEAEAESEMPEDRLRITGAPGPIANSAAPLPKYAALFNPYGDVRAAFPPALLGLSFAPLSQARRHAPFEPFDATVEKVKLRAIVLPLARHEGWRLVFALPRADVDRDDWLIGGSMLVVFAVALAGSVTMIGVVVRRLARSYTAIVETAQRVAEGDLSARVRIHDGDKDIVRLATNIDFTFERLERLVESQHFFIAHAAHELRSPLTTAFGSLELALRQPRQAEDYRRMILAALEAIRHLTHLADDLLLLARVQGDQDAHTESVFLPDVVYEALQSLQGPAQTRSVRIRVREEVVCVDGRPRDLERMVRNLIENAVRYSAPGGSVQVEIAARQNEARILVQDEGPGVPPGASERIFQPFARTDDSKRDAGVHVGLGLAIAREIARRHGGDIAVERPGRGARFVVTLPASKTTPPIEQGTDGSHVPVESLRTE